MGFGEWVDGMKFNKKNNDYIVCAMWQDGQVTPVAWSETKPSLRKVRSATMAYRNHEGYKESGWVNAIRLYDNKRDYRKMLAQL